MNILTLMFVRQDEVLNGSARFNQRKQHSRRLSATAHNFDHFAGNPLKLSATSCGKNSEPFDFDRNESFSVLRKRTLYKCSIHEHYMETLEVIKKIVNDESLHQS